MSFNAEQVKKALDSKASRVSQADLARIVELRAAVEEKLRAFPAEHQEAREQGELLFAFLESTVNAPLVAEAKETAGALLYLSAPVDLVPDHEPGGYADDAAVLDLAVGRIRDALRAFCDKSGRAAPAWLSE